MLTEAGRAADPKGTASGCEAGRIDPQDCGSAVNGVGIVAVATVAAALGTERGP